MKPSHPSLHFDSAYHQVTFYDPAKTAKPVLSAHSGPPHLSQILTTPARSKTIHNPHHDEEIYLNTQPLYIGEVDHSIEEIGIMTVKQVRYVDDEEWEAMLREQKKYTEALKRQTLEGLRESRKIHAAKRQRNPKGQFTPKQQKVEQAPNKNRKISKKAKRPSARNDQPIE